MPWIELHQNLLRHPKLIRLASKLGVKKQDALWHILSLWLWALDYAESGNLETYGPSEIAFAAEWGGDAGEFVKSLQECRWLDGLMLHDWMDYAGRLIEQRDANKRRMRDKRAAHVQRTTDERVSHVGGLPNQPTLPTKPDQPSSDLALQVMKAYPTHSKDGRQIQGVTLNTQSILAAKIKAHPDFPWLEAAKLEHQNDFPKDIENWLKGQPDPIALEHKRNVKPGPKSAEPQKKTWKLLT